MEAMKRYIERSELLVLLQRRTDEASRLLASALVEEGGVELVAVNRIRPEELPYTL